MIKEKKLTEGFTEPHVLSPLPPDSAILVAFSGGADSRVLLDLLFKYSRKTGARLCAAHVNHGIRGEEADRDEAFCKKIAEGYGIELFTAHLDIPAIAKETKKSVELAARDERYAFFERVMKAENIPLLAVAHNANDNLETMLFNLTRGSALSGLCGIPHTRECGGGLLIRPILSMTREEILEYTEKNSLDYVTDSTNTHTEYARNRIRAEVIPALKELNSSAEKNASATSVLLRRDAELIARLTEEFLSDNLTQDGTLPLSAISSADIAIASRAVIRMYSSLTHLSLEEVHVEDILELCRRAVAHSRLSLRGGVFAVIENSALVFTREVTKNEKKEFFVELCEGRNPISQTNSEIIIGNTHNQINIYKKSIQLWIDSAKIKGTLIARERREGDRILMGGMRKSIKKLMCDKKIPLEERRRIPVICDGEGIVAVPFLGVRDDCGIKKDSRLPNKTLEVNFYLY